MPGSFLRIGLIIKSCIYILRRPSSLRKVSSSNWKIQYPATTQITCYGPVFQKLCWGNILLSKVTFRDPIVFAAVEIHNTVESRFLEPSVCRTSRYLEPNLVPLGFSSLKLYNFTPDFSKLPISQTNLGSRGTN